MSAEREKERIENAQRNETEIRTILKKCLSEEAFETSHESIDTDTFVLLAYAWDIDVMKECLKEFNLDIKKLPFGLLQKEKIKKSHAYLTEIQRHLTATKSSKIQEEKILELNNYFN